MHAEVVRRLPHSANAVWSCFAAFAEIDTWHPLITDGTLEAGEATARVGSIRRLLTRDQEIIREELTAIDENRRTLAYRILDSPFPVTAYVSTVAVREATTSGGNAAARSCSVTWSAEFTPENTQDTTELHDFFTEKVYQQGITELDHYLRGRSRSGPVDGELHR